MKFISRCDAQTEIHIKWERELDRNLEHADGRWVWTANGSRRAARKLWKIHSRCDIIPLRLLSMFFETKWKIWISQNENSIPFSFEFNIVFIRRLCIDYIPHSMPVVIDVRYRDRSTQLVPHFNFNEIEKFQNNWIKKHLFLLHLHSAHYSSTWQLARHEIKKNPQILFSKNTTICESNFFFRSWIFSEHWQWTMCCATEPAIVDAFIQWKYVWPATATAVDVCKLKRRSRSNWSHKYMIGLSMSNAIVAFLWQFFFRFGFVLELKTKKMLNRPRDITWSGFDEEEQIKTVRWQLRLTWMDEQRRTWYIMKFAINS